MTAPFESFTTSDGVALRLSHVVTGRRDAILVVPGSLMHRATLEHRLLASRLSSIADVLTLDVRGHGESGGRFSFGGREPEDLAELWQALRPRFERVLAIGFSFGGYSACIAAAQHGAFDAVALVAAPHRLFILDHNFFGHGLLRSVLPALRRGRRRVRVSWRPPWKRRVPSELVGRIAPRPLLVVHGSDDWLIAPAHARKLYEAAAEPKRLVLVEHGLHAENMLSDDPEPVLAALEAFARDVLRGSGLESKA